MRYLLYIILIILVTIGAMAYRPHTERKGSENDETAVVVINDRTIGKAELEDAFEAPRNHIRDREEFIEHLIIRELLIQESQRQGIHNERSFLKSIQSFYEQSLIKAVMDRRIPRVAGEVEVKEEEVERYVELMPTTVRFTLFSAETEEAAREGRFSETREEAEPFSALAMPMKHAFLDIRPGEKSSPFPNGRKWSVCRLDSVTLETGSAPLHADREKIRRLLLDQKKEEKLSEWITELRRNSRITIRPALLD